MGNDANTPTVFSKSAARRIATVTSRLELLPYDQRRPYRRRSPVFPKTASKMVKAKDDGSGAAANGGSGNAHLNADGSGAAITYTNPYPVTAVPTGNKFLWLNYSGGTYEAVSWEC